MTHSDVNDMTWLSQLWMTWLDSLVLRDSFISDVKKLYLTWLIHEWHDSCISDVTHSYLTWLIHMWRDSFISDVTHSYLTWLIHVWCASCISDVTHSTPSYSWHDSFVYGTTQLCEVAHSHRTWHMWRDRCTSCIRDMTHSYVTPALFYWYTATHCNILLQLTTATCYCNTLQHTATHCNTLQHTATHCRALSLVAWFRARLNIQVWMRHTHMGSHVPYEWVMPSWPVLGRG